MTATPKVDSSPSTIEERVEDLLSQMTLKEKVALLSGLDNWNTVPIERLGVPSVVMTDGPHGVRANQPESGRIAGSATSFPTGISMAASWDPALIERVGAALGEETRAMGCDILLGPCVNIVRGPLAGRNFESYSEDPFLAGRIGVGYVRGVQSKGVGTSLKHYACNNQEFERNRGSSVVDERTLREIYLSQFETVVKEAQPWTVMCSYNRINGVYASQNNYLLNDILRDEWGFEGLVVSDWGANHTIFESIAGGLDLEMPGPAKYYGRLLVEAVRTWQIDEASVDQAARRVLRLIIQSGRLDDPSQLPAGSVNTPEHQVLARELAEQSITLLKNDNHLLPLKPGQLKTMAVIGPNAADARIGGGGSSFVEPPYRVSPLSALKTRLGQQVEIAYAQGCDNYVDLPVLRGTMLTPTKGIGAGLWTEYYAASDFSGQPTLAQVDPKIDFWTFISGSGSVMNSPEFSARWTAKLEAPGTGPFTFKLTNTDICRLYLDGKLLVENSLKSADSHMARNYRQRGTTATASAQQVNPVVDAEVVVELEAGRSYDIKVEYIRAGSQLEFAHARIGFAYTPKPEEDTRIAQAVALAKESDVAIIFAGMPEGFETEGRDRPHMDLPGPQVELIRAVAKANPNTVVVVHAGAPVAMPWLDEVPAVIEAYYPGQEAGNALTRVLIGEVNPSGKLPVTFPKRLEDTPSYVNYPGGKEVRYGEGIFVGYRYYDAKAVEPLFPFGHGLSYTTFEYSGLQVPAEAKIGELVECTITVKNTGKAPGKEVVQLYVHDQESSLARPPKELKGFAKVALQPGESKTIHFSLDRRAFAFYDPDQKDWVVEPGRFEIQVGSSSRDIRAAAAVDLTA